VTFCDRQLVAALAGLGADPVLADMGGRSGDHRVAVVAVTQRLIHGDCLVAMHDIADGSVDMVLCDPPYGTTACKWDSVIPFEPMWAHLKRIVKPNGAIVLTASQPFTSALVMSNVAMFKYCWVWEKSRPTGHVHTKNKPLKKHEDITVFSSGTTVHRTQSQRRMCYHPQGLLYAPYVKKRPSAGVTGGGSAVSPRKAHKKEYVAEYTNYPTSILKIPSEHNGAAVTFNPTQKPVALMEYLIRTYTNPGETVLDFTMGSGTTGVACINTARSFIGIELGKAYFETAEKRIATAQAAPVQEVLI